MPRAILGELTNQWPLNPGNRKVIVFTAFADTARYLYDQLAPWVKTAHGIDAALVTGTGGNRTTLDGLHRDLSSILTAFGGTFCGRRYANAQHAKRPRGWRRITDWPNLRNRVI